MKRILTVATAAALMLLTSVPAGADISFWLGRMSGEELMISGTATYGGAVGFSFARYFGVELVVDYIPDSELPFDLEEVEEILEVDVRVDLLAVSGNFLVQYPITDLVTPYCTVGYGGIGAWVKSDLVDEPDAFGGTTAMNWGFGAKIRLAPFVAIRGDIRWYRLNLTVDDLGDLIETIENPSLTRIAIGASLIF